MKILIVDDSIMMRTLLKDYFTEQAEVVVGEAANGKKALELVKTLDPDLIIMDIDMPVMDGIEAAEKILSIVKKPIVIFANDIAPEIVLKLQGLGVAEVLQKPLMSRFNDPGYSKDFIAKIRAHAVNSSHREKKNNRGSRESRDTKNEHPKKQFPSKQIKIVVMGASTGGPEAVRTILSALPPDFPVPIALVQHIETRFSEGYAEWLNGHCTLRVKAAVDGDIPKPGVVYVASGDVHLVVAGKKLVLDDSPHIKNQRPAVEKLFQSASESYGPAVMGVILTGMGSDGADGAATIRKSGGHMIVQDESTSFINGMPKAAIEAGGASLILPLQEIAPAMEEAVYAHR